VAAILKKKLPMKKFILLFTFFRAYQLIVQQLPETYIDAANLTDYSSAKEKGLHYYIAAEINPNSRSFPQIFSLGNGKFYGKYKNVELEKGKKYEVLQRALTQDVKKVSVYLY
jgi:hypothetical protein